MELRKDVRQVYRAGQSMVVTLPPDFIREHGLEPGDQVEIVFGDFLKLEPVSQEELEKEFIESRVESGGNQDREEE